VNTRGATQVAVLIAVTSVVAPLALHAQRGASTAPRPLAFFIATQGAAPPAPADPSRIGTLSQKITVEFDGIPVREALRKIAALAGLRFVYAGDVVDDDHIVHLKSRDITVAAALAEALLYESASVVLRSDGEAVLVPAGVAFVRHDTASTVRGAVIDADGKPVSGAEVYVTTSGRSGRTDASGRYSVGALIDGPTRLRARMPGWVPVDTVITLDARTTTTIDFVLARRSAPLDTVRVSADACSQWTFDGFDCRRRVGVGVFRDEKEISARPPIYFADLFDGVAGVRRVLQRLDVGEQATTQWRCIAYLENGRRPLWKNELQMNFRDVTAIEYYDSPEKIPQWYKNEAWRGKEPCSLAVLWLRGAEEGGR
jgi:hypothetical protein